MRTMLFYIPQKSIYLLIIWLCNLFKNMIYFIGQSGKDL